MSYYTSQEELQRELVAFLTAFLSSDQGARATEAARALGDSAKLCLHIVDPDTTVSVDFFSGRVVLDAVDGADVDIEIEADALHDILLERLDPVQISRLYETDRVHFRGSAQHLAALIMLAGPLAPFYRRSLADRGRDDLLGTPAPPTRTQWGSPDDALSPKRVIGRRRAWQRPTRAAEAI